MKFVKLLILLSLIFLIGCAEQYQTKFKTIFVSATNENIGDGSFQNPYYDLQTAINNADNGDKIIINSGIYNATPELFTEDLCGNCQQHQTRVYSSRGFLIENKMITISGINSDSVILNTNAGYGVLFNKSNGSIIENVTITGGKRDPDVNATDAAIVAKFSSITIRNCKIINNDHRLDSVVVGVGGIFGREGSELYIQDNLIYNNSWDGIALYRGAMAVITDNTIEQGRGAGIGVTWDAVATILRNRVSHYWKGIGSFGTSRVTTRNNIVMDCLGWGIIATGTSFHEVTNNLIYRNGNCGFANWSDRTEGLGARGICANNIIMDNGWREQWVCPCIGVWMMGRLRDFPISYNCVYNNKDGNFFDMPDFADKYGNVSLDPLFADTITFKLSPSSPLINIGHPEFTDPDGSPTDIGPWGGTGAKFIK